MRRLSKPTLVQVETRGKVVRLGKMYFELTAAAEDAARHELDPRVAPLPCRQDKVLTDK